MGKMAVQPRQGPQWFVVQTQVHREREAKVQLLLQGFEVYCPMRLNHKRAARPISPFFPRYLFVRFDPSCYGWLAIASTVGVHDIIRRGDGRPSPVPDAMIDRIRSWEVEGVVHLVDVQRPTFKAGDRVVLTSGPFKDLDAIVTRAGADDRVHLMLGLVNRPESLLKMTAHTSTLRVADVR